MREISRRELLVAAGGTMIGLAIGRPDFLSKPKSPEPLEFLQSSEKEAAANLSIACATSLLAMRPRVPRMQFADVTGFEREYVMHLAADGLVPDNKLVFPRITETDYYQQDGSSVDYFHVLGESACNSGGDITVNSRMFLPTSNWRQSGDTPMVVSTVAHELSHSNQVACGMFESGDIETATQMVAMNTLFTMSMEGNKYGLPGGLDILSEFADSYALMRAFQEQIAHTKQPVPTPSPTTIQGSNGSYQDEFSLPTAEPKMDLAINPAYGLGWYANYLDKLPDPALQEARYQRMMHYWNRVSPGQLQQIVMDYGYTPYVYTQEAMQSPFAMSRPLPIGKDTMGLGNDPKQLDMFSTKYVTGHLQELVRSYK